MLTHVQVERDGADLIVTWTGDPAATIAAETAEIVAEGSNRVRVLGLDPAVRHYVTVAAPDGEVVMAAERLVPLTGTMNFRDLGGYRGEGGRTVRWGRVFRSDGLDLLTDDDVAYLGHLGIVTVCDFRNDREVGEAPSRLPGTVDLRRLPIGSDSGDTRSMVELMVAGELTQGGVDFMADLYVQMLDAGAEAFATAVALAADPANLPLLVHCTAGKDRTGIISALILSLLGVREDDIVDDYELTTKYRSGKRIEALRPQLEAAGVDVDAVRPIFTAERAVLVATLEDLRARWGGIEDYLTTAGKLAPAVPARLRQVLLA